MIIAIYRQYARIYQLLQNSSGTQFEKLRDGFTVSAYKWAVQIIQTRQNGYPGMNRMELNDLLLIPVVDLCNHDFKPTTSISKSGSDLEKSKFAKFCTTSITCDDLDKVLYEGIFFLKFHFFTKIFLILQEMGEKCKLSR